MFKSPGIVLLTTISISIAVMFIDDLYIALMIFLIALSTSLILDMRIAIALARYITPMITIYTAIAWIIQFIVTGEIDLLIGFINLLRFSTIATISLTMLNSIDIPNLIIFFNRLSPRLGIALALSIKMMKSFSKTWIDIHTVYKTNFNVDSYIDKIKLYIISVKVFVFIVMYVALQSIEALLTRCRIFKATRST